MAPQAVDGTGVMVGPGTGLVGTQREWRSPPEVVGTKNYPCVSLKGPACA